MKKYFTFQIEDIEELANSKSFERGEDYYESGAVKKITRSGNHFEAMVRGSQLYTVSLDVEHGELNFYCNCPYDFDGICKHSVALGLAILDGDYKEVTPIQSITNTATPIDFAKCYSETEAPQKLNFLKQMLDKDTDLQSQFVAFVSSRSGKLDDVAGVKIDKIAEDFVDDLMNIDFDDEIENGYNRYDYYDDEEFNSAYDLIDKAINTYYKRANEYQKKGNLLDAFRIMLGMYIGAIQLENPDSNYDLFCDGYSDYVLAEWSKLLKKFSTEFEQIVKSDENVQQLIDVFFVEKYKNIKLFEPFFISIVTNRTIALYLYNKITENQSDNIGSAFIVLKIAEVTENEKLWIETAERYVQFDPQITQKLLDKYKDINQIDNFNRTAHTAFAHWNDTFDTYIVENIDKNTERKLFVEALAHQTKRKHKIKDYKILREYLSPDERNRFIEAQSKLSSNMFYIELLEVEERFEEIFVFIKAHPDIYDLASLIRPILNIYPDECFGMLRKRCDRELNSYGRNRNTYQSMVKYMTAMKKIETKQAECKLYFDSIFSNRLPALKDEMRKAKLV